MAFGISIKAVGPTASAIRELWDQFGALEVSPSMAALGYPPHVTLGVYDAVPEPTLRAALRAVFDKHPPVTLRFAKLAFFEQPDLVVYAVPDNSSLLLQAHEALNQLIDVALCRAHYQPGHWVPHCTLATDFHVKTRPSAKALAALPIDPFEVIFDVAECVEFYPVRPIEDVPLK